MPFFLGFYLVPSFPALLRVFPEDYTLYRVGNFNDVTGKMEGEELEKLATGLEMVAEDRRPNQANLKLATEKEIG